MATWNIACVPAVSPSATLARNLAATASRTATSGQVSKASIRVFVVSGLSVHAKSSGMASPWPVKNSRRVASTGSSCSRSIQVFFTFAVLSEEASEVCGPMVWVRWPATVVTKQESRQSKVARYSVIVSP